jgi:hypothetical protein
MMDLLFFNATGINPTLKFFMVLGGYPHYIM